MKTKIAVLVGIALSTMLLISPALASGVDTLGIYGNANEDDTIDMRDLTYVKLIFFGKKSVTELADAKYDGKINPLDFIQIKLIIVGKEKELTLIDSVNRIVTVKKPVNRIIPLNEDALEILRSIGTTDRVVGVETRVKENQLFYPELSKLPSVGKWSTPDLEAVLNLEPDLVICYKRSPKPDKLEDKLPKKIVVVRLECDDPDAIKEEVRKLGYIFDKKDEAGELIDFYEGFFSEIEERISEIEESEQPTMFMEWGSKARYRTFTKGVSFHQTCVMAGGINIAADLDEEYGTMYPTMDAEWVIEQNPDFFIRLISKTKAGYVHDDPSEMEATREEIMSRPELANTKAVKNGDVYVISAWEVIDTPRYFVGVAYLAKWFHPELFEDLDPQAIHEEYLERFQGVTYRGVYAYPEPN
jgi:iron complex transport system substrate-binding protein